MSARMTLRDIAAAAELSVATVRRLHADARKQRAEGTANERTLPAPVDTAAGGVLLWNKGDVKRWLRIRQQPARRGAVPKQVLHDAIAQIEAGRVDAGISVMKEALQ